MLRRMLVVAAAAVFAVVMSAVPAFAGHDHYIVTPQGKCHQVAAGQTAIADAAHGGYHQFHDHVHTGAAAPDNRTLGHGNGAVLVYKAADAPDFCF